MMLLLLFLLLAVTPALAEPLFEARQLTPASEYTFGIEGPAVDAEGNLYVVNYARQGTIGKVATSETGSQLFAELPLGSVGVSIRFGRDRRMYVADYKKHNIFVFEPAATTARAYFHSDSFNQPNDMAIARDGTIYASDPNWRGRSGQVWRIVPAGAAGKGAVMATERKLTTTNGIDLSPDEKTLYVAESETREIWAYRIDGRAARRAAPREKILRLQSRWNPHRHRQPHLCRAHLERHDRGADAGRQDRARDHAFGQGADQPCVRRAGRKDRLRHTAPGRLHRDVSRRSAGPRVLPAARAEAIRRAGKRGAAKAAPRCNAIRLSGTDSA